MVVRAFDDSQGAYVVVLVRADTRDNVVPVGRAAVRGVFRRRQEVVRFWAANGRAGRKFAFAGAGAASACVKNPYFLFSFYRNAKIVVVAD